MSEAQLARLKLPMTPEEEHDFMVEISMRNGATRVEAEAGALSDGKMMGGQIVAAPAFRTPPRAGERYVSAFGGGAAAMPSGSALFPMLNMWAQSYRHDRRAFESALAAHK